MANFRKELKQREAAERQAEHNKLTTREKLEKCLDRISRLGGDAVRERTRLEALLIKESSKVPVVEAKVEQTEAETKKKVKAKDRRKQEGKR